jgi:hypothetical protein
MSSSRFNLAAECEAPFVNAAGHVMEAGSNVHGQAVREPVPIAAHTILVAVFDCRIPAPPTRRRASGQTAQACSGPRAIRGRRRARCAPLPAVGCCRAAWPAHRRAARASSRRARRESPQNRLEEGAQHKKLLRQPVAQPQPGAVGKHQRGDGQRHHDAQHHFAHAVQRQVQCGPGFCTSMTMVMVTPASRELLRRPSNPQTITAVSTARMKFHGSAPNSENEKPSSAPISVPKCDRARRIHCGTEVRLQHDDGADRAPVAVVQPEAAWPATSTARPPAPSLPRESAAAGAPR